MFKTFAISFTLILLLFVLNAQNGITDNNDDICDVLLTLSGSGSTNATVIAKNLTTGTTYSVPQVKGEPDQYFLCTGALNTNQLHKLYVCTSEGIAPYKATSGSFSPGGPSSEISMSTVSGLCNVED